MYPWHWINERQTSNCNLEDLNPPLSNKPPSPVRSVPAGKYCSLVVVYINIQPVSHMAGSCNFSALLLAATAGSKRSVRLPRLGHIRERERGIYDGSLCMELDTISRV